LQPGLEMRACDYAAHLRWLEAFRLEIARLFRTRCDAVLTPSLPVSAPGAAYDDVIAVSARLSRFTWVWAAARCPALSLPCGFTGNGLPISLQLAGPRWSEPLLLRLGHAFQLTSEWHLRRPPL
jgi:aspartyl-tRNA(Asn)/glutamyl-tRNA(Gln) amidotransferase subunit A